MILRSPPAGCRATADGRPTIRRRIVSSLSLLRRLPQGLFLVEAGLLEALAELALDVLEPADEPVDGRAERDFGVHPAMPRDADDAEQQVADLGLPSRTGQPGKAILRCVFYAVGTPNLG